MPLWVGERERENFFPPPHSSPTGTIKGEMSNSSTTFSDCIDTAADLKSTAQDGKPEGWDHKMIWDKEAGRCQVHEWKPLGEPDKGGGNRKVTVGSRALQPYCTKLESRDSATGGSFVATAAACIFLSSGEIFHLPGQEVDRSLGHPAGHFQSTLCHIKSVATLWGVNRTYSQRQAPCLALPFFKCFVGCWTTQKSRQKLKRQN